MVFWTGILVGGLFVWLAVRMGFYETWAMLFNVVVAVYAAVFLTPVIVSKIPAAGDTAYGNALTLTAVAAAVFLLLALYLMTGMMHNYLADRLSMRTASEFASVALAGLVIVVASQAAL